jgi:hypothetical protein
MRFEGGGGGNLFSDGGIFRRQKFRYNTRMPLKARFLLLFGTLLESLSLAIGILLILVVICQLADRPSQILINVLYLVLAVGFGFAGHRVCSWIRRKYPIVRPLLPPNMPIAIVAACLQILGIFGCVGVLLAPSLDPSIGKSFTSGFGGYLRWAIAFLFPVIFLAAGLFLRHCLFRSSAPAQGFEVLPQAKFKE